MALIGPVGPSDEGHRLIGPSDLPVCFIRRYVGRGEDFGSVIFALHSLFVSSSPAGLSVLAGLCIITMTVTVTATGTGSRIVTRHVTVTILELW